MTDEPEKQSDDERNQAIKDEFAELISSQSHDTETAIQQLSIKHKVSRAAILALVNPPPEAPPAEETKAEDKA